MSIDDDLAQDLMKITGQKNAAAAIRQALDAYRALVVKNRVLALRGQVPIEDSWRQLRRLETSE